MALGSLVVSLGLDASDFISGMTKSEQQAKKFGGTIDSAIASGVLKAEIAIRALGAAARTTAEVFQSLTTGAGKFQDLSDSTGDTAENIASLAVAAATAGISIEEVAGAANKLTKNLVGVDDESKAAGAALKALNINVKDFKGLDPVGQYEAVSKALAGFADGAGKVAVAQALFGKSGADQLRVFKALEDAGGRQTILTARQIQLADDYSDQQARTREQLHLYAQAAASEAIPAISDLTKVAADFAKELLGVDDATGKLNANNGAKAFAEGVADTFAFAADQIDLFVRLFQLGGKSIAGYAAVVAALGRGSLAEARAAGQAAEEDINRVIDRSTFADRLAKQRVDAANARLGKDPQELARRGRGQAALPVLKFNGADESLAARTKSAYDAQIKAAQDFAAQQKATFDYANRLLAENFDDGLTTLREYFGQQQVIRDAGLRSQLVAIDAEIAARRKESADQALKPEQRIDASGKLAEAERKRSEIVVDSARANVLAYGTEGKQFEQFASRLLDLQAQLAEGSGDTKLAASLRASKQIADAQKVVNALGADPAIVDQLARQIQGQSDLSEAQKEYARIVERARNGEESLLLAAQEGGKSELETLRAVGAARAQSLDQLGALVDKANELALSLGTPDAIQFAEQLGLAFKKATAEVDPLLVRIRDIGGEVGKTIADGFSDAILEGKGLTETLHGLDKALARIALNELFTKPFQQYLSGAVGGNGQASGGGGAIGSLIVSLFGAYLGGSTYSGNGIGDTSAYFGAGGSIGGGRAGGGPTMPNTRYGISEVRPEVYSDGSRSWLITGSQRGRVDPNPQMGGSRTINAPITINVPGSTDRRTASQIGAEVARQLAVVSRRNN